MKKIKEMLFACAIFLTFALAQAICPEINKAGRLKKNYFRFSGERFALILSASATFYKGALNPGAARYLSLVGEFNQGLFLLISGLTILAISILFRLLPPMTKSVVLLLLFLVFSFLTGGLATLLAETWAAKLWQNPYILSLAFTSLIVFVLLAQLFRKRLFGARQTSPANGLGLLGGILLLFGMITTSLEQTSLTLFQPWPVPEIQEGKAVLPAAILLVVYGYRQGVKHFK